jgi:hypothetical protein
MSNKTVVPNSYYGLSRETWAALSALITRMQASNPSLAGLPKQFGKSRAFGQALDGLIAAVSALDHQQPNSFFNGVRNRRYARDTVATIVALEARITAAGF